ncbi:MAG: hypothetical protein ACXVB9_12575 [Bdellovibrionota bacterium]
MMFRLIAPFGLLLLLWGNPAGAISLSKWQEKQVLSALKDYCGNAWCEGDYEYKFRSFTCHPRGNSCRLHFELVNREKKTHFPGSCHYAPAISFKSILGAEGGADSLNDSFIESLDDCFEKAENRLSEKK